MKKLIEVLTEEVKEAFSACGYEEKLGQVALSNRPDLCQFQCNGAMAAAKVAGVPPIEIAKRVAAKLLNSEIVADACAVMPGFINMNVNHEYLAAFLQEMSEEENFGFEKVKKPLTIVMDYGGANVAKPLHVGHLRSAVIGESVKRICRYAGNKVIGDVHLGDWGLPMGLVIEGLRSRQPELVYFDESYQGEYPTEPPFSLEDLESIYPEASRRQKEDAEFRERAHNATLRLQQGERGLRALWKHIMAVSIADLRKMYDRLHTEFDVWKGESDIQYLLDDMLKDLEDRGFAKESQGATVVEVKRPDDTKEIPPCIVRKSDGAALYATWDLATILEREKLYAPDRYIYLTDKRQEMHFIQVFRVARMAGFVGEQTDLYNLCFGTMNGKGGTPFKTRDGGVMHLETLLNETKAEVLKKVMDNREISVEEAEKTAETISIAAIKYGDLSNQATKDYIFDMERFTSFDGNSGPYLLYTMVRIKSILAKLSANGITGEATAINASIREYGADELAMMLLIARFNDVMTHTYEEIAPHRLCGYCYELCNAFNSFYHNNKIITEEDTQKRGEWISTITLVLHLLEICIDLLGFSAPERM